MAKVIMRLLLISLFYSCTPTVQVPQQPVKAKKYRVVAHKSNGETIKSKTQ